MLVTNARLAGSILRGRIKKRACSAYVNNVKEVQNDAMKTRTLLPTSEKVVQALSVEAASAVVFRLLTFSPVIKRAELVYWQSGGKRSVYLRMNWLHAEHSTMTSSTEHPKCFSSLATNHVCLELRDAYNAGWLCAHGRNTTSQIRGVRL